MIALLTNHHIMHSPWGYKRYSRIVFLFWNRGHMRKSINDSIISDLLLEAVKDISFRIQVTWQTLRLLLEAMKDVSGKCFSSQVLVTRWTVSGCSSSQLKSLLLLLRNLFYIRQACLCLKKFCLLINDGPWLLREFDINPRRSLTSNICLDCC